MRKHFYIPLFWKYTIAITFTVVLFGIINLYFIRYALYDLFENELTKHAEITAISVSERSIIPIAYGDMATLNQLVNDEKNIDPSIAYMFILDKNNKVIAHSFQEKVPPDLINANAITNDKKFNIVKIKQKNNQDVKIMDISYPIMNSNMAVLRIGIQEASYAKSKGKTTRIFLYMLSLFLVFGIIGAFIFSFVITVPIKGISNILRKIELGTLNIQEGNVEEMINKSELVRWKNFLNVSDEIDTLINSFGEMVHRLGKAYEELQNTQSSLIQSEKMASLGTLSSGIAHEINNPIAGIQNCVRRLKENPENIKQNNSYLEMIESALKKIEKVVRGLLDFSRKPNMQFTQVNLNSTIENALLLTSYQLEKARISIKKEYDKDMVLAKASGNYLEQVVLNLILNSIDAIEEKKVSNPEFQGEITIKMTESRNYVSLEVSDDGIGLPEEKLPEIFNPFFTMKTIRAGTGLGLAVSYSIVERHNGKISAHINKKNGLTFIVKLPKN